MHPLQVKNQKEMVVEIVKATCRESGLSYLTKFCKVTAVSFNLARVEILLVNPKDRSVLIPKVVVKDKVLTESSSIQIEGSPYQVNLQQDIFIRNLVPEKASSEAKQNDSMSKFSYAGIQLKDSQLQTIGLLCLFADRVFADPEALEAFLTIFAVRVASELERLDANALTQELLRAKIQSEKLELLGRFANGITHDLNNVLMGVSGNLQVVKMRHPDAEAIQDPFFESALRAAERAANLAKQIMMFAKEQKADKCEFNLSSLAQDVVFEQSFRAGSLIKMQLHSQPRNVMVFADPVQIEQLILNLIVNAIQACKEMSARIDIRISQDADSKVRISVSDTGLGMSPEVLERAFEPFYTGRKSSGTGLGLSIVSNIVEHYQGQIQVQSQLGKGSSFEITLPIGLKLEAIKIGALSL